MENTRIFKQERCEVDYKQVVYLREYIIYEQIESQDKYAIFKFFNNYHEKINGIEFLIKQYDKDDNVIAENIFKYYNFVGDKQAFFAPYTKFMVEDECCRLEAVLLKADFEKHHYSDCKLISQKDLVNVERGLKPSRKEKNTRRVRKLKNKNRIRYFLLAPFLLAIFVLLTIYFINSVDGYAINLREFSDNNFHYTVTDGNATVDGYLSDKKDIEIISEINLGSRKIKVTKIAARTFSNSNVRTVNISAESITIEDHAFSNCENLTTVRAKNVDAIKSHAFIGCVKLEEFSASSIIKIGNYAFEDCAVLKDVNFSGTKEIGKYAFNECSKITSVVSETIEKIDDFAFNGCAAITTISVPKANIGEKVFYDKIEINEVIFKSVDNSFGDIFGVDNSELPVTLRKITCNAERIDRYMFNNIREGIELAFHNEDVKFDFLALNTYYSMIYGDKYYCDYNIEIIDNTIISINDNFADLVIDEYLVSSYAGEVVSISPDALAGLTKVTNITFDLEGLHLTKNMLSKMNISNVTIGEKVTFDDDALSANTAVTNLYIYNNENISYNALIKDSSAVNLTVYAEKVQDYYFQDLSNIEYISLPITYNIGDGIFAGCTSLVSYYTPFLSWQTVPRETFMNCKSLSYFDMYGVVDVYEQAFAYCENLSVNLDSYTINSIGNYAFVGCDRIEWLRIGENVKEIGAYAFGNCKNLNYLDFASYSNLEIIGEGAFYDCVNLTDVATLPFSLISVKNAFSGANKIARLNVYNTGVPIDEIGSFEALEELNVHTWDAYTALPYGYVKELPNLKKVTLPSTVEAPYNVVYNCPSLEFITMYVNSYSSTIVGGGCENLKYVTIYNSCDFDYSSINVNSSSTKTLYIYGNISRSTMLSKVENLSTLVIDVINVDFFGQIFGAWDVYSQNDYIPETLKNVEIGNYTINSRFFMNCYNLENVALTNASYIYSDALTGLNNLKNIYFGNYLYTSDFVYGFNNTWYNREYNVVYSNYVGWCNAIIQLNSVNKYIDYSNRTYKIC